MSQSDVRESLCAIQKYPSALPRDISVCETLTKKIFSTFTRGTTQKHKTPYVPRSKSSFHNVFNKQILWGIRILTGGSKLNYNLLQVQLII